ncbi:MAG TPA: DUF1189 family protein [Candidatus Omnitrophota bacterium]|nr:DUF1189 family protein [Candidatus Omnitrophota bacterium]HQO37938.1 DUF1189 family protein [Candidatus Omnitrophota bacterium]HQQ05455.1 DUF1189 family protein [Candidatus Omnitrophota bacterium]
MFGMFGAFDPGFYPRISRQSVGRSIGFLLVFVLIISAAVSVKYTAVALSGLSVAKKWVNENMPRISAEFPVIKMAKGDLIEPKQAFVKEYKAEGQQFAVIIEPEPGKVSEIMSSYQNAAILTARQLLTKQTSGRNASAEIKTYNLENASFTITPGPQGFALSFEQRQFDLVPKFVNRWIDIIGMWIFPVLVLFWFVVYSCTKPLHVFIFSLVSLIIVAVVKVKMTYKEIWNTGAYALVPATCIAAFCDIIGLRIPFFPLVYILAYVVYLYLGIRSAGAGGDALQPATGQKTGD